MGKKSRSKSKNKIKDSDLAELEGIIDQISQITGTSSIKTRVRDSCLILRFILDNLGSETDDTGILLLSVRDDNTILTFRSGTDKNKTRLAIGRKILMNYLIHHDVLANTTVEEVDDLGYLTISRQGIQGVLYDLISFTTARKNHYYFRLCSRCVKKTCFQTTKSLKNAKNTLDLYSGLCAECKIATSGRPNTDVVTDAYRKDPNIVKFLLLLSLEALDSTDRFTPFPITRIDDKVVNTYAESVGAFSGVTREIGYWISILNSVDTDEDLYEVLADREYEFVKFVIDSNNTILSYFDYQFGSNDGSAETLIRETDVWDKSDLIVFAVTHDAELEDRFNKVEKSTYFYHGSPPYNWHSILRNGLKNYSGTAKQSHGAAYGQGIYLAAHSGTSMGYSHRGKNGFTVIAIAQVIDADDYKKGGIYVVPDESKVLIKYLILNKGNGNNSKKLDQIFKYLTTDLPTNLDHNRGCMTSITDRRLRGELANLRRRSQEISDNLGSTITIEETTHDMRCAESTDPDTSTNSFDSPILRSRVWDIRIASSDGEEDRIKVEISYQYPLVPPKITVETKRDSTELRSIPLLIEDGDSYRYYEPALSHLVWKPGTKLWTIVAFLIESISSLKR